MNIGWINGMTCPIIRRVALGGVLASGLLGLGGAGMPATQAAGPSVLQQMAWAIAAARSYAGAITVTGSAATGATSAHIAMVVIRARESVRLNVKITSTSVHGRMTLEMVDTGVRVCLRTGAGAPWSCMLPPSTISAYLTMEPDQLAKAMGLSVHASPSGTKLVQGQRCVGYSMGAWVQGGTIQGTYWLDPATMRPLEIDSISTLTLIAGQPPVRSTMRSLWSHWNDPTLAIAPVTAQ